jgi:type III pantothenate kinase
MRPYVLGENITAPIRNRYRKPRQVGQDRLVNAYAAACRWGVPAIVVDYGTAVTFDIVSQKNDYIGGMIFPGLQMSLAALHEKTALLPRIKLAKPSMFFGRNTRSSILSGVIYGYAAMTESLVSMIQTRIAKPAVVIGTGGDIKLITGYTRIFTAVDPHLTLKGLQRIYEARTSKSCACSGYESGSLKRVRPATGI